jgi:hypothetical protein
VEFIVAILEGGDALGDGPADNGRAPPVQRIGQRAAGHELGDSVEQAGERDLRWSGRPVVGEDLVGPPAEEKGVHVLHVFEDVVGLLAHQWRLPSAVREAAVAVIVRPSGRLCHPVQRYLLGHDELAHGLSSW